MPMWDLAERIDRFNAGVGRLENRVGRERRRHEDQRRVGAGVVDRIIDGVEDRDAVVVGAALAGAHARDDLGAVLDHQVAVELPDLAQALDDVAFAWSFTTQPVTRDFEALRAGLPLLRHCSL